MIKSWSWGMPKIKSLCYHIINLILAWLSILFYFWEYMEYPTSAFYAN